MSQENVERVLAAHEAFNRGNLDAGGDRLVVVVEARMSEPRSGLEVRQKWAQLISLRDNLIERVEPFPAREAALEAAGLQG